VIDVFGAELDDGDVFLLNDPYRGGTHLPDLFVTMPVFAGEQLLGFTLVIAHHSDIGGGVPGGHATGATELYQEGLIIPPSRLYKSGALATDVIGLLRRNVRVPEEVTGDLESQVAACRKGMQRLRELAARYGAVNVAASMRALLSYAERLTLAELATLPKGIYNAVDFIDDDGTSDEPIRLEVALDVRDDKVIADFSGSSVERKSGLNCVPATALGAVHYGLRSVMSAEIPDNGGVHRCIEIRVPTRSIVNPAFPAPVAGRGLTAFRLGDVVLRALAGRAERRHSQRAAGRRPLLRARRHRWRCRRWAAEQGRTRRRRATARKRSEHADRVDREDVPRAGHSIRLSPAVRRRSAPWRKRDRSGVLLPRR
jgi:N-methylhydantoinase B